MYYQYDYMNDPQRLENPLLNRERERERQREEKETSLTDFDASGNKLKNIPLHIQTSKLGSMALEMFILEVLSLFLLSQNSSQVILCFHFVLQVDVWALGVSAIEMAEVNIVLIFHSGKLNVLSVLPCTQCIFFRYVVLFFFSFLFLHQDGVLGKEDFLISVLVPVSVIAIVVLRVGK